LLDHFLELRQQQDGQPIGPTGGMRGQKSLLLLRTRVQNQLAEALVIWKEIDGESDLSADQALGIALSSLL
jgi:hypothetical protein